MSDALTMTEQSATPTTALVRTMLICDEHADTRRALVHQLAGPSVSVVAVADETDLLDAFARHPADVVLIGVHRGTPGGARAIDLLLGTYPTATVIVFGSVDDATQLTAALTRGARGLMLWSNIGGYEPAVPGRPGRSRLDGSRIVLTRRELQVLRCMSNGKSNLDTGRDLFLSEDTIKTHARALFQKLGARDRAHAVALGLRHGLLG